MDSVRKRATGAMAGGASPLSKLVRGSAIVHEPRADKLRQGIVDPRLVDEGKAAASLFSRQAEVLD
jgi:hypothetical protein